MLLTDDVCECGWCTVDLCEICERRPVTRLDDEGTAYCSACWDDDEPPAWYLERTNVWDGYPEFERGLAARRFK